MPGPLSHLTVLDLSRVLAGPWCTQLLADLGATVIKIEKPGSGDDTRHWGPPFLKDRDGNDTEEAAYYLACNRGKLSVAVDFTKPKGSALLADLASQADVLVENYKVGGLAKYGLDYARLSAKSPRLVYCSITGFGQHGPYAERAGYDFIIQGMGGFMSVTGEADHLPGGGPQKAGIAISDLMTGMYASTAITAAIAARDAPGSDGRGQYIDASLLDTMVAMMAVMNMNYLVGGTPPGRLGNAHQNIVPYEVFACADGHLILAVGNDGQFARFCEIAGKAEWATDPHWWYALVDRPVAVTISEPGSIWNKIGFHSLSQDTQWQDGQTHRRLLSVPGWIIGLPVLGFGVSTLWRNWWRPSYRRKNDLCVVCGYDLRATPDRCPECGAVPEVRGQKSEVSRSESRISRGT